MKEYYIKVTETHYIYTVADSDSEAIDKAEREAFNGVPDAVDSVIEQVDEKE